MHSEESAPAQIEEAKAPVWVKQELVEFDWKSAASLRAPEKKGLRAERAWETTEWDDPLNPVSQEARRVAEQLDGVAQKIRKGELSVDGKAPTPETAMVAALEALIRAG
ncbi:MAG: hypothetical protein H0W69_00690 [Gemmatimonadaceae bacterium]|nr:hypothetical protein [Gemmatimonadaceae bacterium]